MKILKNNKHSILSNILKCGFVLALLLTISIPVFAGTGDMKAGTGDIKSGTGDMEAGTGLHLDTGIKNPIAGIEDIPSFIMAILNFVLVVGIPIITLAIIYSGFLFVTAQGNSEKLGKAKKALMYTIIGAALMLGSYVISHAIKGTVDEIDKQDKANQANQ